MMEIPLFPLNLVLFPGMPINLHIFEERYKIMINECIDKREPFGVVLITNNVDDTSENAETSLIGCTAQITQVQPLQEGRMNISAIGKDRFQITSFKHDKPYPSGLADPFPLEKDETPNLMSQTRKLRSYIESYLSILQQARQSQFKSTHLPNEPTALSYLGAVLLQTEPEKKQELLATQHLSTLVNSLLAIYQHEVRLLRATISPPENIDFNDTFSLN